MTVICWSAKGGSGATLVAVSLALCEPQPGLIVDLAGDVCSMLGIANFDAPGVTDWLGSDLDVDRLDELVVSVDTGLSVLPAGQQAFAPTSTEPHRLHALADWCAAAEHDLGRAAVIDAGLGPPPTALTDFGVSLLVTRSCYLALQRASAIGHQPDGVVLVSEPRRVLGASDVERCIGAPIVATIEWDPDIQRAIDSGLLRNRIPRSSRRALRDLVTAAPTARADS